MGFDPSPQENAPSGGRRKVINELVQGRELANRLQSLLTRSTENDVSSDVVSAEDLVMKIMDSFTNTLGMLKRNSFEPAAQDDPNDEVLDVVSQVQPCTSRVDSPCLDGRKSEDSQESCRSTSTTTNIRDRRGCYKRR